MSQTAQNELKQLWESVEDLHTRFAIIPAINLDMRLFFGDVYSFSSEVTQAAYSSGEGSMGVNVHLEAKDVLVGMIGVMRSLGFTYEDFSFAIRAAAAEYNRADPETHIIRDGKPIWRDYITEGE